MPDLIIVALGGLMLVLGLGSKWMERVGVPPVVLSLLIGVLLGPKVLGVFDLNASGHRPEVLEFVTRMSLGVGIMSLTLFVPKEFLRRHWGQLFAMVSLSMVMMWVVSTALVYFILGLPLLFSALIGAMLSPTDPVAARPIIEGVPAEENLPDRLRHLLADESASNDGAAYPFVFLPFLLMTLPHDEAMSHFFVHTIAIEIIGAAVMGVALGYGAARILQAAEARDLIKDEWRLVYTAALSLFAVGLGHLLEISEFVLVFAMSATGTQVVISEERKDEEHGHEAANRFLSVPVFALMGTALPWAGWHQLGWKGPVLAVAVVLFRRLPAMLVLGRFLPLMRRRADALYIGWFGPIGIATIYYGVLMEQRLQKPVIWDIVSLIICVSVLTYGLTATPLTKLYGRVTGENKVEDKRH